MISLSAPAWLFALCLVPVIWWLHRFGQAETMTKVSAVFLFDQASDLSGSGAPKLSADPRWILRAILFSMLALALAAPRWEGGTGTITVWVDDSASMYAREGDATRIERGIDSLLERLVEAGNASVTLRSLSNGEKALPYTNTTGRAGIIDWLQADDPRRPVALPTLAPGRQHWLLTDGGDPVINRWAGQQSFAEVIRTGTSISNVAITRVSARKSLVSPEDLVVGLTVESFGSAASARRLTVRSEERVLFEDDLILTGTDPLHHSFSVPSSAGRIVSTLSPGDALGTDDEVSLSVEDLQPVATIIDPACGPALQSALSSHPALRRVSGDGALAIQCSQNTGPARIPTLRVFPARDFMPVQGPAIWLGDRGPLLDPSWLRFTHDAPVTNDKTLLFAPKIAAPLITAGSRLVNVLIDLEHRPLILNAAYPQLVDYLLAQVLDRALLDPIAATVNARDESDLRVAPLAGAGTRPAMTEGQSSDMVPPLLGLALVLLLADILTSHTRISAR